ncbi:MAG: hydrogenase maturation protease [Chromatiaceae bacterium]|nr:hydrogenase maturation protease [Chromatiaceae bacterium]MCP5312479.1 hydrogenase maturation protease [Chromatiaceae bacterium]
MIRVIGIGSPFGDDRVGWQVVDGLAGRVPATVDLVTLDRPGAALINWMEHVDHLLLIDAIVSEAVPPGRIVRIDRFDTLSPPPGFTSHVLDLAQTIELADALGVRPRNVELYGISIAQLGTTLPMPDAVDKVARQLTEALAERLTRQNQAAAPD